jgi:hypothetical protein
VIKVLKRKEKAEMKRSIVLTGCIVLFLAFSLLGGFVADAVAAGYGSFCDATIVGACAPQCDGGGINGPCRLFLPATCDVTNITINACNDAVFGLCRIYGGGSCPGVCMGDGITPCTCSGPANSC